MWVGIYHLSSWGASWDDISIILKYSIEIWQTAVWFCYLREKESIERGANEGIRSWDDGTNQAVNEICHKALLPEFHTWEWKKKSQTKLMNFHLSPFRWLNQWTDCEKSMYPINRRHFLVSNWVICCKTAWTAAAQKSNWEKYLLQRVKIKFALLVPLCKC